MVSISHTHTNKMPNFPHERAACNYFQIKQLSRGLGGSSSSESSSFLRSHFYQATAGWCRCSSLMGQQGWRSTRSPSYVFSTTYIYVCVCMREGWDGMDRPLPPINAPQSHSSKRPAGQWCAQMRNETPPT